MSAEGKMFKFESFATKDGDGVRGVVFLTGCPLRCAYCHNPDSWRGGETVDAESLAARIARFKPYYRNGGGATVSGGEPLVQGAFVAELIDRLHTAGISVALDTSGSYADAYTDGLIAAADHIILDLKFPTEEEYARYTGGSLAAVLDFLRKCRGKRIWLRTVVLPAVNDTPAALDRYLDVVAETGVTVERYELLAFHTMGFAKYESLGLVNPLADMSAADAAAVAELQRYVTVRAAERGILRA